MIKRNDQVDAILTSDWHMMEKERNPPCRTDIHFNAQAKKIKQIQELQKKHNCPVFFAGDLFEHWKGSPELINHCLSILPKKMAGVAGQHDLPQHNLELIHKSAFESMVRGGKFTFLKGQGHWGFDPKKIVYMECKGRKIVIAHMLVWKDDLPFPDCPAPQVSKVFRMFPKADLILTGDNHQTFTAKRKNQLLVNPGSLTRHKADQAQHKPCVFLWNATSNKVVRHFLKIRKDVIVRDHIDIIKEKEARGEAFISSLSNDWLKDLDWDDNVDNAIQANDISKPVQKYIFKWCGR